MNRDLELPFSWDGFLSKQSSDFDGEVAALQMKLDDALRELHKDPSAPENLANYQALLSEYTLYRNAQSNITKTYKDVSSAIISNFR